MPWCGGNRELTTHRLWPNPQKRAADGVARHGDASYPQAGNRQVRRGRKEESAHGVQVGIPHTVLCFNGREDETAFASDSKFLYIRGGGTRLFAVHTRAYI